MDEAYHDFLGENFLSEAADYPNVIVGRTFSKAFGLAGMRVGVMIASPAILAPIRQCMPLFNLNVVAVAALARRDRRPVVPRRGTSRRRTNRRNWSTPACERAGLRYWKSGANFVLIDGGDRARELVDGMIAQGVFVRDRTKDPACPIASA